jgi:hypothetical protein
VKKRVHHAAKGTQMNELKAFESPENRAFPLID